MDLEEKVQMLYDKDNSVSYKNLLEIEKASDVDNRVYKYIDKYIFMLNNEKTFVRVRGFRLICKNAKWDKENRIDKNIDGILLELKDEKPTAVRQCLSAIKELIFYKPKLRKIIKENLLKIDCNMYADSMKGLIEKDIQNVLNVIDDR